MLSANTVSWLLYFGVILIGIMLGVLVWAYWPRSNLLLVPPVVRREVGLLQPCNQIDNVCIPGLTCVRPDPTGLGSCRRPLGQVCATLNECVPDATACTNGICVRSAAIDLPDSVRVTGVSGGSLTIQRNGGGRPVTLTATGRTTQTITVVNDTAPTVTPVAPTVKVTQITFPIPPTSTVGSSTNGAKGSETVVVVPCASNEQCPSSSCMTNGRIVIWDPSQNRWVLHSTVPDGVTFTRLVTPDWAISVTHNANTDGLYHWNSDQERWVRIANTGMWSVIVALPTFPSEMVTDDSLTDSQGDAVTSYRLVDMAYSPATGLVGVFNTITTVSGQGGSTSINQGDGVYRVMVTGNGDTIELLPFRTATGLQLGPNGNVIMTVSEIDVSDSGDVIIVEQDWTANRQRVYVLPVGTPAGATFQSVGIDVPRGETGVVPRFYTNNGVGAKPSHLSFLYNANQTRVAAFVADTGLPTLPENSDIEMVNGEPGRTVIVGLQNGNIVLGINGKTTQTIGQGSSNVRFLVADGRVIMYTPSSCA